MKLKLFRRNFARVIREFFTLIQRRTMSTLTAFKEEFTSNRTGIRLVKYVDAFLTNSYLPFILYLIVILHKLVHSIHIVIVYVPDL